MKRNKTRARRKSAAARPARQVLSTERISVGEASGTHEIVITLTRNQTELLAVLGRQWGVKDGPIGHAAVHLLNAALADHTRMKARVESEHQYLEDEGFSHPCHYYDGLAKSALAERGIA